ncbi:unnamed protein product [Heterosigma akashiwo]
MAQDDGYSASELRQRYNKGGTYGDDQLTAAQLRARHGIQSNKADFSTSQGGKDSGGGSAMMIIVIVLVIAAAGAFFFLNKS